MLDTGSVSPLSREDKGGCSILDAGYGRPKANGKGQKEFGIGY
jgi:hypothetical protein